jgi:hypothetical protein
VGLLSGSALGAAESLIEFSDVLLELSVALPAFSDVVLDVLGVVIELSGALLELSVTPLVLSDGVLDAPDVVIELSIVLGELSVPLLLLLWLSAELLPALPTSLLFELD